MNASFNYKRILVTGGCQDTNFLTIIMQISIGKEICLRLSKYKATVFALSNNRDNLERLAKENPQIKTICVDLMDWNATRIAVKRILPIDMLVNNAGIGNFTPFLKATPKDFDNIFSVNVKAMFNVSQIVAENMIERKIDGSIVNLSSIAGEAAQNDSVIYCSSKGAVNMLSKTMALELGPYIIRVNYVQPTVVMTELGKTFSKETQRVDKMLKRTPLGRFAEVEEVVDSVEFLLSKKSSMISGSALRVDGGYLAC